MRERVAGDTDVCVCMLCVKELRVEEGCVCVYGNVACWSLCVEACVCERVDV